MLDHFRIEEPLDTRLAELYGRGSRPLEPGADAVQLEELIATLGATQERLLGHLAEAQAEHFQVRVPGIFKPQDEEPRGIQLGALVFHECYHVGQLGTIRTAIGRAAAIQ